MSFVNDNFEEMVYYCKMFNIHEEILRLKNGYDTILNSNDDKLKPDSKILLNIVRIVLKNTHIMIFDEVIGSLNNENKTLVLDVLNKMKEDHTIIIVDDNEQVFSLSDNIILLDEGNVCITGQYLDVSKNKLYKKIVGE